MRRPRRDLLTMLGLLFLVFFCLAFSGVLDGLLRPDLPTPTATAVSPTATKIAPTFTATFELPTVTATATQEPTVTPTAQPTATVRPTATAQPTSTVEPTATATATAERKERPCNVFVTAAELARLGRDFKTDCKINVIKEQ